MIKKDSPSVKMVVIDETHAGQRVDNFLFTHLKGLPKSRIYRALRKGEVRINKKRIKPDYKLRYNDEVRIPPLRTAEPAAIRVPGAHMSKRIEDHIIVETSDFIVLNKPSGMAVHGGSGISLGVIEALRHLRPKQKYLELVHRLDRETSGILLVAKKSSILKEVHSLLLAREVQKTYLLLVAGECQFSDQVVDVALRKNILKSGERIVVVDQEGKPSITRFITLKHFPNNVTLVQALPMTGRTHQIRVHAAYIGHPIIGDEKYGDEQANKRLREMGIKQLCLHSQSISFYLESKKMPVGVCARLLEPWSKFISTKQH